MKPHDFENPVEVPVKRLPRIWSKLGGNALTFALVFHVVLLLIAALCILHIKGPVLKEEPGVIRIGKEGDGQRGPESPELGKKIAAITPTTDVKRIIVEDAVADFIPPESGNLFGELTELISPTGTTGSAGLGNLGTGRNLGPDGPGSGNLLGSPDVTLKPFGPLPLGLSKRCAGADRMQRIKDNGGNPACEDAVLKGLRWLKANQNPDGSWGAANQSAMTGLALLAYLGHCETPGSTEFGESCAKGIVYLMDLGMKNDGKMGAEASAQPFCYEHAIATYALAEATTLCKDLNWPQFPALKEITQKAGQFILDHQHENGGWSYAYLTKAGHTDVSVVGWQMQALKACSHTEIKFRGMSHGINKGLAYLDTCQNENGAFGYQGPPPVAGNAHYSLTGVGMLAYQMWGKGHAASIRKGAKYTLASTTFDFKKGANLYAHYYESQAMMQSGGENWKHYNDLFRDQLLNNQERDGSWKVPPGSPHVNSTVFSTCLSTLMLEVYYRFLSTGGRNALPGI